MTLALAAALAGYLIGSLPLGSMLVRALSGKDPRAFSAHNLGLENLLYFIGAPTALASFALDLLKGFLAVMLSGGSPWAGVGVFAGHLYPLRRRGELPRGRGNGVLLGVLAAWQASGRLGWGEAALPVLVFAALLALTGYAALATMGGLLAFALVAGFVSWPLALSAWVVFLLALWRHKVSLARILDRTEAKLGEPPAVHGRDPGVVLAAFMVHPMSLDDLWQPRSQRWLKLLVAWRLVPEGVLRAALLRMRPQIQDELRGIELSDGRELRVLLVVGSMLPDQIRRHPEVAKRMAVQGARLALERGAEAFGLGAFWSTVGNKGLEVQAAVPEIAITNGGAYTAATVKAAVPGLLAAFEREGGTLRRASAAVVGANGVVAFGVARIVAPEVAELILVGRDAERLEKSAEALRRKYRGTRVSISTDLAVCAEADLIFSATSDPAPVIYPQHVKPGAWIFDLGRPADAHERVREVPGVHIVPGGVVRPPGSMRSFVDLHFGDGMVPACMAETMIMTATRAFERRSLGPATKSADIAFYLREGARLGFEIVTRDEHVTRVSEVA